MMLKKLILTFAVVVTSLAFAGGEKGGVTSAGQDPKVFSCLYAQQTKPKSEINLSKCNLTETQNECAEKLFKKGYPADTIVRECIK